MQSPHTGIEEGSLIHNRYLMSNTLNPYDHVCDVLARRGSIRAHVGASKTRLDEPPVMQTTFHHMICSVGRIKLSRKHETSVWISCHARATAALQGRRTPGYDRSQCGTHAHGFKFASCIAVTPVCGSCRMCREVQLSSRWQFHKDDTRIIPIIPILHLLYDCQLQTRHVATKHHINHPRYRRRLARPLTTRAHNDHRL